MRAQVRRKAAVLQGWMDQGRLTPLDPIHLLFTIWATTQHYADFDSQIRAVLGREAMFETAEATILKLFFEGLGVEG
ncbi:TetR family transcriptional regulator C-terminal domain-containing protein [Aquibaculum sediminis]|uniref:TetR family transcriptional regulator C-terminal domain-containing protein n=1 Tax=Aquibaculum sediminis TaxID=3231907 RepID=UPI003455E207